MSPQYGLGNGAGLEGISSGRGVQLGLVVQLGLNGAFVELGTCKS